MQQSSSVRDSALISSGRCTPTGNRHSRRGHRSIDAMQFLARVELAFDLGRLEIISQLLFSLLIIEFIHLLGFISQFLMLNKKCKFLFWLKHSFFFYFFCLIINY